MKSVDLILVEQRIINRGKYFLRCGVTFAGPYKLSHATDKTDSREIRNPAE